MSKLTNAMREEVIKKIHDETIKLRYDKVMEKLAEACQEAADKVHSTAVLKWIKSKPKSADIYIGYVSSVEPCLAKGVPFVNPFMKTRLRRQNAVQLKKPYAMTSSNYWDRDIIISNGEALQEEINLVFDDWETLRVTLQSALYSCNTIKQLQEKYPDLAEKLPVFDKQTKALAVTEDRVKKTIKCAAEGGCK